MCVRAVATHSLRRKSPTNALYIPKWVACSEHRHTICGDFGVKWKATRRFCSLKAIVTKSSASQTAILF